MQDLDLIAEQIREEFETVNAARDQAYSRSRRLVSLSSKTIRALHREEWDKADSMLAETQQAAMDMIAGVDGHPNLYYAGYTQDALKEYVEAFATSALMRDTNVPTPDELKVESNTWLNGLAEAATEMRRRILDIIRHEHNDEAERLLGVMDTIYSHLVTFDFNDSITGGLRRRTDTVRAVLERTRGDVTTSFRQSKLEEALKGMEQRLANDK
jgi:translin